MQLLFVNQQSPNDHSDTGMSTSVFQTVWTIWSWSGSGQDLRPGL